MSRLMDMLGGSIVFMSAVVATVAAVGVGCASGGSGILSRTTLSADQLAEANYETVYDLLRSHNRARIVSANGQEHLTVYRRGGSLSSVDYGGRNTNPDFGESQNEEAPNPPPPAARVEEYGSALLIVNEQEVQGNPVPYLRQMSLDRVKTLKILRPSETSARYGGEGRVGAVVIVTKGSDRS